MVWDRMASESHIDATFQLPSLLTFCTVSVPLCLFFLGFGFGFVSKLKAQGKAARELFWERQIASHHSINQFQYKEYNTVLLQGRCGV